MGLIIGGSVAFSIGAAFMGASQGFTRLTPSLMVALSFIIGAALIARAVQRTPMSTTIVLGLGIEALLTVLFGVFLLGDRLTLIQGLGMLFVVIGVALVRAEW
jgi:multidrug transporter EmrE-like cation transporter